MLNVAEDDLKYSHQLIVKAKRIASAPFSNVFETITGTEDIETLTNKVQNNIAYFCTNDQWDKLKSLNQYIYPSIAKADLKELRYWREMSHHFHQTKILLLIMPGLEKYAAWFQSLEDKLFNRLMELTDI